MKSLLIGLLIYMLSGTENMLVKDIQSKSGEENKKIVVYFSGSDWCSNCYQFTNTILNNAEVGAILDSSYVYYTADFPQRKKLAADVVATNEALAAALNPKGEFPVLVIADKDMHPLARIYKGHKLADVVEKLKSLR